MGMVTVPPATGGRPAADGAAEATGLLACGTCRDEKQRRQVRVLESRVDGERTSETSPTSRKSSASLTRGSRLCW